MIEKVITTKDDPVYMASLFRDTHCTTSSINKATSKPFGRKLKDPIILLLNCEGSQNLLKGGSLSANVKSVIKFSDNFVKKRNGMLKLDF